VIKIITYNITLRIVTFRKPVTANLGTDLNTPFQPKLGGLTIPYPFKRAAHEQGVDN